MSSGVGEGVITGFVGKICLLLVAPSPAGRYQVARNCHDTSCHHVLGLCSLGGMSEKDMMRD